MIITKEILLMQKRRAEQNRDQALAAINMALGQINLLTVQLEQLAAEESKPEAEQKA